MGDWLVLFLFLDILLSCAAILFLYSRVRRLETQLREQSLMLSKEHLNPFAEEVDRWEMKPVERDLLDLRESLKKIEAKISGTEYWKSGPEPEVEKSGSLAESLEAALRRQGFSRAKILTQLDASQAGPHEVLVEAFKDGVCHKGRLVVEGGSIIENRLQPSYELFP